MKFKKNILLGISMLTLAGFAVVGANAGSGKACSQSASAEKAACSSTTTASSTTDAAVQTVSNEGGSCAAKASNTVQTVSTSGSCGAHATNTVQTVGNNGSCCASKATNAVQTVSNGGSCGAKATNAVQTVSNNGSCCASKATNAVQTVGNVGSCASGAQGVSAGHCGAKAQGTASNASCTSANPSECMSAWLPKGMNFIRLDVPGGVDFVFSGAGVDKLTQACSSTTSAVAAEHGTRFAMTKGDGYVVLSVRGDDAASCCGEVVETAFATSGVGIQS